MGPTRCTPVALGFKGSKRGSKLGPVANIDENIASGRQSLGMRPRNLRPCGGNGPCQHAGLEGLYGTYQIYSRCFKL